MSARVARGGRAALAVVLAFSLAGCGTFLKRLGDIGGPPTMTPTADPTKDPAWHPVSLPTSQGALVPPHVDSLWQGGRAFFPDQRAARVGDIVTVMVNIKDAANLLDNTSAVRNGNEGLGIPNLFGLETKIPKIFSGANPASLVNTGSSNSAVGTGQIQRSEAVTLSLAGLVTQVLPNGNLAVVARQEVRVNSELRELQVSGIVRPQDIASDNTVAHDRMAEARISYGGRGQLVDQQTPRYGQQFLDVILPF
jgi:flagellar L-ring protein precursor FlgH